MDKSFNIRRFVENIVKETMNEAYINQSGALEDLSQEDINEILRGYIACALWTEGERLGDDSTLDLDVDSKIDAYNSIKHFILSAGDDATKEAIETNGQFQLGVDIWLTRNQHGSGFFDRNYENEEILEKSAQGLGEINLIVGDDGMLHFE